MLGLCMSWKAETQFCFGYDDERFLILPSFSLAFDKLGASTEIYLLLLYYAELSENQFMFLPKC